MVYDVNILNLINEKTRQKIYELSERNKNTDAAIWKVYYHVVPSSISNHSYDKYYIGQCMRDPKSRWGTTGNGYKGQIFYRAIMKYGWDNIGHYIIVDNLLSEEADWLEAELIKQLKTNKAYGYNQTEGGKDASSGSPKKPVAKYTMDGDYICSYESISVASANNNNARISDCIKRGTHHANGFLWYIFEDKPQLKVPPYYKDSNYVERYSLAGEYLDTWRTTEAVSKFGCRLLQHCKDGVPYNGYQFKYKSDKREIHGVEQIYQYDMDGNLLRIYHGLHEVRKDLNLSDNINCYHLHRNDSCLERNVAFGFRWTQKYYEELPPLKNYKNKGRPVVQIDPVTDKPIKIFEQMTDFNVYSHIGDVCRGKREIDGGYKWKFLTDTEESFYEDNPELLKQYRYYIEDWNFRQSHVKK